MFLGPIEASSPMRYRPDDEEEKPQTVVCGNRNASLSDSVWPGGISCRL